MTSPRICLACLVLLASCAESPSSLDAAPVGAPDAAPMGALDAMQVSALDAMPVDALDAGARDAAADADARGDAGVEDAGPTALALEIEAIAGPAFAATPSGAEQCIGGVTVVVTPAAELVRGWGAMALGGGPVPDGDTLFQVGSISKLFTGLGLARRVEEGALSATTSVGTLLAADLRGARSSWPTMGALITHHSGLPVFPENLADRDGNGTRDPDIDPRSPATGYDREDLRRALAALTVPPAAPYLYSNLGVGLAGLALADHLGVPTYHEVLSRLVTTDLAMLDTYGEVAAIPAAARARLATPHVSNGARRTPGIMGEMGVLASAGEIVTTGQDLRRLLRALTGLAPGPLDAAIARATARLDDGPGGASMGYAIEIDPSEGLVRYRKGGNTSGFTAYIVWSTTPAVGVAVLTNCGGFMRVVELADALHAAAR